jgi:hypothetical protein
MLEVCFTHSLYPSPASGQVRYILSHNGALLQFISKWAIRTVTLCHLLATLTVAVYVSWDIPVTVYKKRSFISSLTACFSKVRMSTYKHSHSLLNRSYKHILWLVIILIHCCLCTIFQGTKFEWFISFFSTPFQSINILFLIL